MRIQKRVKRYGVIRGRLANLCSAANVGFMKIASSIVLAFLLFGCASSWQSASLTAKQAETLAIRLANDKTDSLYHCRPFHVGHLPHFAAGRWIWTDSRGIGLGDIQARVELAADGSTNCVDVKLMDSRNSEFRKVEMRRN